MDWYKDSIEVVTNGKGLYPFTAAIESCIHHWGVREGMCFLYIQHTSASLVISESYDPSAKVDMEVFMEKIAPENQPWYRHTTEGSDDSPSHIRSILTNVSLTIPVDDKKLNLGMWQGVYLFEHRRGYHRRTVLIRCLNAG
ncbi:MAG: secondary thiamine-phosphate synthase enzyme YjbQ [Chloroflexota bacterium]|jgi:secondary thiamine-phosphate synthase enzyme